MKHVLDKMGSVELLKSEPVGGMAPVDDSREPATYFWPRGVKISDGLKVTLKGDSRQIAWT